MELPKHLLDCPHALINARESSRLGEVLSGSRYGGNNRDIAECPRIADAPPVRNGHRNRNDDPDHGLRGK